jgi:indole-3-acetate monooxygenase
MVTLLPLAFSNTRRKAQRCVVQMLAKETGATAIFESSRLERAVRDMDAAVKHIAMSPYSYIIAGRLQLGLELGAARV